MGSVKTEEIASAAGPELRLRFAAEADLTGADHAALRGLLGAAFPELAATFAVASFWGARPDHRLWLETAVGEPIAHLSLVRRTVDAGGVAVPVAGVGAVATRPDRRGRGLGRRLLAELRGVLPGQVPAAFGFLACREELVGYYARAGWHRLAQPMRYVDPESGQQAVYDGPTMILPAEEPLERWPGRGTIDLGGLPW